MCLTMTMGGRVQERPKNVHMPRKTLKASQLLKKVILKADGSGKFSRTEDAVKNQKISFAC